MLNWADVVIKKPDVVTRASDDELVVVLPEQGKFIVLNATGARILELADGTHTLHEIATAIADEFAADQDRVETDVLQFAETLVDRQALSVQPRVEV